MAGHMGSERTTIMNLEIVARNEEKGVLFVAGSVPGPVGALMRIRRSRKGSK
jgi:large subunit ribosomal protein L3